MKGADVRWGVAGRMGLAWLITVPAAGIVGALAYWIQGVVGGDAGAFVSFGLLILISAGIYLVSRRKPVNHTNVNDEWEPSRTGGSDETATDGELTGDSYEYDPEAIDVLADAVVMRDVYALSSESDTDEPDPTTSENRA